MEPVTHVLTGICLARTGFNRKTAYAVAAMAVAAEFPDIDMVWALRGPVENFQHHRGITHTFLGLPFEAALIVGGFWLWDQWRRRRSSSGAGSRVEKQTPERVTAENTVADAKAKSSVISRSAGGVTARWGWLYGAVTVALLSHLLLDFTNNYGIRPFYPFDAHWYAWSIVFIFDPILFAMLVASLVAPLLFGLIGSEVGAKRQRFRGRGWAVAGLISVVAWWSLRSVEHGRALEIAQGETITAPVPETQSKAAPDARIAMLPGSETGTATPPDADAGVAPPDPAPVYLQARRTLASPYPVNPFRWSAVTDFGQVYRQADIDSLHGTMEADDVLTPKSSDDAAVRAAEASPLGRAYLDWCPMPYIEEQIGPAGGAVIIFGDPRFMGGWMAAHGRASLVGEVHENAQRHVTKQSLDQRVEK